MANNLDDNIIDKKIEAALNNSTMWGGSTDKMWKEIEPKIKRPVPRWRGVRAMTAAAAAVVVLAASLHYWPWLKFRGVPDPSANVTGTSNTNGDKKEYNPPDSDTGKKELEDSGIKSPSDIKEMPFNFANFNIKSSKEEFEPGEKMNLEAYITALKEDIVIDSGEFSIYMWHLGEKSDKPPYIDNLPSLAGKSIGAGKTSVYNLSMEVPETPGWYMPTIKLGIRREGSITSLTAGGIRFFVKYPEGSVRQGSISVNRKVSNSGYMVTVSDIVMTDSSTTMNFTISCETGSSPTGFRTKIFDDNGDSIPVLGENQKAYNGGTSMVITFGPLLKKYKMVTLEITNVGKVDIDLP
jgi:hypothetical protein